MTPTHRPPGWSCAAALALLLGACALPGAHPPWPPVPAVIGHRGASALRPEHTLEAYLQAIEDGADVIEPDLVITRDGVLIARHENALAVQDGGGKVTEATTDVAERPEFAARKTTKFIDGKPVIGWFSEDFTLDEIKTLRARERVPRERPANAAHDGRYAIPTLQEVIALVQHESARRARVIGIEPETKHPSYFRSIGLPLEPPLLDLLERSGWNHRGAPVVIQSFEVGNLKDIATRSSVRLAQLIGGGAGRPYDAVLQGARSTLGYAQMSTPEGLREIARYAWAVAPYKERVIPLLRGADGRPTALGAPTAFVRDAHAAGLSVQVWTLRPENAFLPRSLQSPPPQNAPTARGDGLAEARAYLDAGVDALFCDDPAVCRAALRAR